MALPAGHEKTCPAPSRKSRGLHVTRSGASLVLLVLLLGCCHGASETPEVTNTPEVTDTPQGYTTEVNEPLPSSTGIVPEVTTAAPLLDLTRTAVSLNGTLEDEKNETVPWWRRWPYPLRQRARPCQCEDYTCGCCAGLNVQRLNISQNGEIQIIIMSFSFQ